VALDGWPSGPGAERSQRILDAVATKFCPKCKTTKVCGAFAHWNRGPDGLQTQCKACNAAYRKTAAYRENDRRYAQSDKGKATQRRADLKRHASDAHKLKLLARMRFATAVRGGHIIRQPCEKCGKTPAQGHHHLGYEPEHFFDVQWLCSSCHRVEHPEFSYTEALDAAG